MKPKEQWNKIEVTKCMVGICHMQVCAHKDATDDEILEVCNRENPAGTSNGWSGVHREADPEDSFWKLPGAVQCADDPDRLHILVSC